MSLRQYLDHALPAAAGLIEAELETTRARHQLMPRDILRLVEDVRLRSKSMGDAFNAGDLVRLSLLRTRFPQLYSAIVHPSNSVHLLESHLAWTQQGVERFGELVFPGRDEDHARRRQDTAGAVDRLLRGRPEEQQAALKETLSDMFPQVQRSLAASPEEPGKDDAPLLDAWRLAHPDVWPFYVDAIQPPAPYRGPSISQLRSATADGSPIDCARLLRDQFVVVAAHQGWRHAFLIRLLSIIQSSDQLSFAQARTIVLAIDRLMDAFRDEAWGRMPFLQERTVMAGVGWRLLDRKKDDTEFVSEFESLFGAVSSRLMAERLVIYALAPDDFEKSLDRPMPPGLTSAACAAYIAYFRRWAWPNGQVRDIFEGGTSAGDGFHGLGRLASIALRFQEVPTIAEDLRAAALQARDEYLSEFAAKYPATISALRDFFAKQEKSPFNKGDDLDLVFGDLASTIRGAASA